MLCLDSEFQKGNLVFLFREFKMCLRQIRCLDKNLKKIKFY